MYPSSTIHQKTNVEFKMSPYHSVPMSIRRWGLDQGYINVEKPNVKRIQRSAFLTLMSMTSLLLYGLTEI